jgi:Phytanoyl-CoA dioxygenase (PhyH)
VLEQQVKLLDRDGVIRINHALTPAVTDQLLKHVLEQQRLAEQQVLLLAAGAAGEHNNNLSMLSRELYGVENQRKKRCDLLLSLVRNTSTENREEEETSSSSGSSVSSISSSSSFVIADALQELLGERGTLRSLYETLVTRNGEFYEFAAVITNPGSDRQQIHPDLPFRNTAPLYVIFVALQDVTLAMGPTTFLLGSHTERETRRFNDSSQRDALLATSTSRLALLNQGDAVLFDARILHCGNANHATQHGGATRCMLNFSFRNPTETGNLGYDGSMRPGYCSVMNLGNVADALVDYKNGITNNPFAKYGNGLTTGVGTSVPPPSKNGVL